MQQLRQSPVRVKYLSTEPVPDYLISSTGAENATPSEFVEAAEAGNDVPALVLKETKDMVTEKKVQLLAYNEQTSHLPDQ